MSVAYNRPTPIMDQFNNPIVQSWKYLSYRGEVDGSGNLIYIGFARPGSNEGDSVWQIKFITYSGSQPISIEWPENASGIASNDFQYSWTDRATYTYA